MRAPLSPVTASIAAALLVVACATPASPAPILTPSPSAAPVATAAPATPSPSPTAIPSPTPAAAVANTAIAAGYQHTCAIRDGGRVTCWGQNIDELADPTNIAAIGPVDVPGLLSGVAAIAAGGATTCALTTRGGVKCWGDNMYGQVGDDSTVDKRVPVDVSGLSSGVTAISVGWSHACALTTGGAVKCWGNNPVGGLGDGTKTDRSVPVDVVGLDSGISAIAAGGGHTCALTTRGGVTCWGEGQAANANTFHTSVPVAVPALASGVIAIAAGNSSTCALTKDGEVTCWGPNYAPPAGETLPDRFVRVDLSRVRGGVATLAMSEAHTCALTGSGRVACWGSNWTGELGTGVTSDRSMLVPVEVVGLSDMTGIAVGGMHTCARTDSGIKCWGSNARGQFGRVTPCSSSSVPVDISLDGTPVPPPAPVNVPPGRIEHVTGHADVVLRYDVSPDAGFGELEGEVFNPGPEFTLYGDGTVIFRDRQAPRPPADGPIIRARPFAIVRLSESQVQALLRFALEDGGLANACDRYETQDTDVSESHIITVHAGGFAKRVDLGGPNPLGPLLDRLANYTPGADNPPAVYVPDRYWGSLIEAAPGFESGVLAHPSAKEIVAWPWPGLTLDDFAGRDEGGYVGQPRRIMTAAEASVLGLSDAGGVVARVYLRGPDGKTIYYFSLWPVSSDEEG